MPRTQKKRRQRQNKPLKFVVPPNHDWRTTDDDERNRRKLRAQNESVKITNLTPEHPSYSNFHIQSESGMAYEVEIRHLKEERYGCSCIDFQSNGLGTCKHVESVLNHLRRRGKRKFNEASATGPARADVEVDHPQDTLRLRPNGRRIPPTIGKLFNEEGFLTHGTPQDAIDIIRRSIRRGAQLRLSIEITDWQDRRRRNEEAKNERHQYEQRVHQGECPAQETKVPLYPYQREGMLHLAFTERALLADEMGLGKTIQAIAACSLLHRLGNAQRVLVVTPASLKSEWEEQIQQFTELPYETVYGTSKNRLSHYDHPKFFTIVNYEQMRTDSLDVNDRLRPDVVILDEAQRIKNWTTKTAQSIKRLQSRYAFVLTGTPIENRIDELHSIMGFIDPRILGPLFRFNRDYYLLNENGRPEGYKNLEDLHHRIASTMIRRRKSDVETELPKRVDHNRFVTITKSQSENYIDHKRTADRLLALARKRPLRKEEMEILQLKLAMMRMTCDTNYILDRTDTKCPKLNELEQILVDAAENDAKVIVFSEWERMLTLVRELCRHLKLGFAWHTGKVPQKKRRNEINAFKEDPECRVFLSTDSGSTGLNLQDASIVVNCDLPWNPAKLEQRIARAWRKHQTKPVTVYNLIASGTIEEDMLATLATKQALADGVLDGIGELNKIQLVSGQQALVNRLQQIMSPQAPDQKQPPSPQQFPSDSALTFGHQLAEELGEALIQCEERFPLERTHTVIVVTVSDPSLYQKAIQEKYHALFGKDPAQGKQSYQLEIIDPTTSETLARLERAGLVTPTTRSSRPLMPKNKKTPSPAALSEDERAALKQTHELAQRKLKMAEVLINAELEDEARPALLQAIIQLGRSHAIANRIPETDQIEELLISPLAQHWGPNLNVIVEFASNESASPQITHKVLLSILNESVND
jgi:hypothetical protein